MNEELTHYYIKIGPLHIRARKYPSTSWCRWIKDCLYQYEVD